MATILVVDDIKANRDYLVTLLTHYGHTLFEAEDGSEGLAAVWAVHPDLIITDVLMPVMDGYELVRQLRLDPATTDIPVVFYTAHYNERDAKALAKSSGVAHVLSKPVQASEVKRIVDFVLSPEGRMENAPPELLTPDFDRQHMRLLTNKLYENANALIATNARLTALMNISAAIASEHDGERRIDYLCKSAQELFGATYVTVGLVDRDGTTVESMRVRGAETSGIEDGAPVPGIFMRVVADRHVLRGNNHRGDPDLLNLPLTHPPVHAFLAVPIATSTHVFGWITLVGNEGRTFTDDDEHLLGVLASQMGRTSELEHEIIEREQAEVALRRERDLAERALNTAQVILLELDTLGRVRLINRYACAMLGWNAADLIGRDWIDTCVPAGLRTLLREKLNEIQSVDSPYEAVYESLVATKSGEERVIEWRNTLLQDVSGQVTGTYSSGTDITERVRASDDLRSVEARMRFVLEAAGVGIWDVDQVTGVVQWSHVLEAQYGLEPGTFPGTFDGFVAHIHPDDRAGVAATIKAATQTGGDYTLQHRIVLPDGSVRSIEGVGRAFLNEQGVHLRSVGISMDTTDRVMLAEQYQQAQKMEAIGRLAGGVAHDFNNLLTVIMGHCELLLTDLEAAGAVAGDVREIQKAGQSAVSLTRQLLAFSRKQIIEPTVIDMNGVITDVRAMISRLIGEDITIRLDLQDDLSTVKADRGQIEQVLINLAVNARDAMPAGGTLTIETTDIALDDEYAKIHHGVKPGAYVALRVTDTGSGMTPEVRARLFEPFFTTKGVGKGTGLGMATVHGIITGIGGIVMADSAVGKGTTFVIYIPVNRSRDSAGPRQAETAIHSSGMETVLIVDDSDALRALARRLLARLGYTVLTACDAKEAIAIFDREPSIDVLLTDVVMPGESGPQLTRRLIEQRPALKVIYMSGYTEEAIVHHGVIKPGIAFLHKPFTSTTLQNKIREVLGATPEQGV